MKLFEKAGGAHTEETLRIAAAEAARRDAYLVVATTGGDTALAALRALGGKGERLVVVTHAYGTREPGKNRLPEETRAQLVQSGATMVTAAHVLSGAERGLSTRFQGVYPVEIIAHSLRMLSQGVKVAVEISVMALDAGAIGYGEPVVAVGGTGRGADTAAVISPAHAQDILSTKIIELLCKPAQ